MSVELKLLNNQMKISTQFYCSYSLFDTFDVEGIWMFPSS